MPASYRQRGLRAFDWALEQHLEPSLGGEICTGTCSICLASFRTLQSTAMNSGIFSSTMLASFGSRAFSQQDTNSPMFSLSKKEIASYQYGNESQS